jgi:hypothetical protein
MASPTHIRLPNAGRRQMPQHDLLLTGRGGCGNGARAILDDALTNRNTRTR